MTRYWLGCCGWAYEDWVGPFYPPGTPAGEFLERYARVFRAVEVDASFYRPPSPAHVRRWAERTPAGFRFTLKVPRAVTHERGTPATSGAALDAFVASLAPLREAGKLGAIVLQFPPSFRHPRDGERLASLLGRIDPTVPLAVELRHDSWWLPETRRRLEERRAALVWSVTPDADPPPWATSDFLYARCVGDRALERFDRIQRPQPGVLERLHRRFDDEGRSATTVFAFSNNHFMGFGPGTVVAMAQELGEPAPDLGRAARRPGQSVLSDRGEGPLDGP